MDMTDHLVEEEEEEEEEMSSQISKSFEECLSAKGVLLPKVCVSFTNFVSLKKVEPLGFLYNDQTFPIRTVSEN